MKRRATFLLAAALAGCAPTAYGVRSGANMGGVKSMQLTADSWDVRVQATWGRATLGSDMALYRAAILASANGFSHFQTVDFEIKDHVYATNTIRFVKLIAVGRNDAAAPLTCRAKPFFASNCKTLDAEQTVRDLGPTLGQTAADAKREIATVRASGARMRNAPTGTARR